MTFLRNLAIKIHTILSGEPVAQDEIGWKLVGTVSINPSDYIYSQASVEYLVNTTDITNQVRVRLWNVTTASQIGTTQTSLSMTTVRLTENITLTPGLNIYEVQVASQNSATIVLCSGARIILE